MKKVSFTQAIKLVHPDLNNDIENSSEKITLLKKYKNDELKIYLLLVEWGIIKDKSINVSKNKEQQLFEYIFNSINPDFNKWIPLIQSLSMIKILRNSKKDFNEMMNLARRWGINVNRFE